MSLAIWLLASLPAFGRIIGVRHVPDTLIGWRPVEDPLVKILVVGGVCLIFVLLVSWYSSSPDEA